MEETKCQECQASRIWNEKDVDEDCDVSIWEGEHADWKHNTNKDIFLRRRL